MTNRFVSIVELDMDRCTRTYGVSPCLAIGAASNSCFNTRASCQYPTAYAIGTQTIRFSEKSIGLPPEVGAIPCIKSISKASAKLTPMKGLGQRASVTVTFEDFAHHDRGFDPYVASRLYDPEDHGTFWGRFRARHRYYQGRILRIRTGVAVTPWSWDDFEDRSYVIDKITGPDAKGKVTITAKDVLKLADDDRATCPLPSTSTLTSNLTSGGSSLVLSPAGIGAAEYAGREQTANAGYVRIGSEIMAYTRSSDTLTLTRAQWGSTAAAHSAGDSVQLCASWSAVNVATMILELLEDYAALPSAFLTSGSWAAEAAGSLSSYAITGILSKPEGVNKILGELAEQCMLLLWWDEVNQLVEIKGISPPTSITSITDDANLVMGSMQVEDDPTQRVSQLWLYYNKIDFTQNDKPENYRKLYIQADLTAEGDDQYGEQRIRQITSRWLTTAGPVAQIASRSLNWLRDNPKKIKFLLDSKDRGLDLTEAIEISSRAIQTASGDPLQTSAFITERSEDEGRISYAALSLAWHGHYSHVAPGGSNASGTHVPSTYSGTISDYSTATDPEKAAYAYTIGGGSNATGTHIPVPNGTQFADGGDAYQIT